MGATPQGSAMQKIIDPHLHFFDLNKGDYTWLMPNNPPFWSDKKRIFKNNMPSDLIVDRNKFDLIGGVHIEAGFDNEKSQNELCWLEQEVYTIDAKYVFKSISYVDLKKPVLDFQAQLNIMFKYSTFKGVRYTLEGNTFLSDKLENIAENLKILESAGILLEIQLSLSDTLQASYFLELITKVPKLRLVVNHSGLPPLSSNQSGKHRLGFSNDGDKAFITELHVWEKNLAQFAKLPNCFIKCSGFEMNNRQYKKQDVIDIIFRVHKQFGIHRMMFASNFPLTLFTLSYNEYWTLLYKCAKEARLDCDLLMFKNAKDLYQF